MLNPEEAIAELRKYLKKLTNIIETQAKFTLIDAKLLDKKTIDDVLCCIEATIPDDYKKYIKQQGPRKLKSNIMYYTLKDKIQNKFFFSTTVYAVKYKETLPLINSLAKALEADIRFVYSPNSGMF